MLCHKKLALFLETGLGGPTIGMGFPLRFDAGLQHHDQVLCEAYIYYTESYSEIPKEPFCLIA